MQDTIKPQASPEARELPLDALRSLVAGPLYGPADEGYEEARLTWNRSIQQEPAVVVFAASEADVRAAVRFAGTYDLPIGVQATGHGLPRGCDGGVLINLSRMNAVEIDAEAKTARLQGGAKWADVLAPAAAHGLAGLCGSAPHVGVVGYTLGGGYGLLLRKYGLAIDAVLEARVVTADGEVRIANKESNPELFWSLLGGGGAFGVVTEMTMRLFPDGEVYGGVVIYPAELTEKALTTFVEWVRDLPDLVTPGMAIMNLPPLPMIPEPLRGKAVVTFNACVTASAEEAEKLLAPMRSIGTPIMDSFGMLPFDRCGEIHRDPVDPLPAVGRGVQLRHWTRETVRSFLAAIGPIDRMPNLKIEIRSLGGAMARVPADDTPIGSRRDAEFLVYFLGVPNPYASAEAMAAHAEAAFMSLGDAVLCRGPLNWLGEGHVPAEMIRAVFTDDSHTRLQRTKQTFDPENRFRFASVGIV